MIIKIAKILQEISYFRGVYGAIIIGKNGSLWDYSLSISMSDFH